MQEVLAFVGAISWWGWMLFALVLVFLRDVFQKKHTIKHNFPIIGNIRYMLESIGPEMRQYLVANNREELPFNRSERLGFMQAVRRRIIIKVLVQI
jgi:hypothetical protein